jgi:T5SS/PEP-CTERM-associated repeat protein
MGMIPMTLSEQFTRPGRLLSLAALAAGLFVMDSSAHAQTDYFWKVTSGDFLTGTNWNPTGPPTDPDRAIINNGGTSTFSSGTHNVNELIVGLAPGTSGVFAMTGGELTTVITRFGESGSATATINNATLRAMTGEEDIFVGGENGPGTGVLTISGANSVVTAGDDFIMGRTGTGTLNVNSGLVKGGFTVVGKFGTGTWNHTGGVFDQNFGDIEIGDGGRPDQAGEPGPRTGTINVSGGVLHATGHVAIGNRVGGGTVNVSGGALDVTGDPTGSGTIFVGRGMNWEGNPGVGGATAFRVIGGNSIIAANGGFTMKNEDVASSSTLIAQITGTSHSTINVTGDADISRGAFKVELNGYTPVSGNSWTILAAGADLTDEQNAIDAIVSAGGYEPLVHNPGLTIGNLIGPFASTDFSMAPLTPGLSWNVSYADNKVTLSVTGMAQFAADFNHDGKVTGADLAKWKTEFGMNASSNADGDSDSDGNDFLIWQRQLGSGGPAVASVASVPEPTGMLLLAMSAVPLLRRHMGSRRT